MLLNVFMIVSRIRTALSSSGCKIPLLQHLFQRNRIRPELCWSRTLEEVFYIRFRSLGIGLWPIGRTMIGEDQLKLVDADELVFEDRDGRFFTIVVYDQRFIGFLVSGFKALCRNDSHTLDFHHQIRMSQPLYPDQRARRQLLFEILVALVSAAVVLIHIYGERRSLNHVRVIATHRTQRAPDVFANLTQLGAHITGMNRGSVFFAARSHARDKDKGPASYRNNLRMRFADG